AVRRGHLARVSGPVRPGRGAGASGAGGVRAGSPCRSDDPGAGEGRGGASLKTVIGLVVVVFLAIGCGHDGKEGGPPPSQAAPAPQPDGAVVYGEGFFPEDTGPNGATWHWMGEEGVISLPSAKHDMVLKITGIVPVERFRQPPAIALRLNGEQLDQFTATSGRMEKVYTIRA